MQCKCGFENTAGAKFCRKCGSALVADPGMALPHLAASPVIASAQTVNSKPRYRPLSGTRLAVLVLVVALAGAGYWWSHRPPRPYRPDNGGLYPINVNDKFGFMDRSGRTVLTPQFDATYGFSEGLAAVRIGDKYGYIDTKGVVVITPQFDAVRPFSEGLAVAEVGTKFGYIDRKGLMSITPQFDGAAMFHNGHAAVKICCGPMLAESDSKAGHIGANRYGFIDKRGKYVGTPGFLFVQSDFRNTSGWAGATLVRTPDDRIGVMKESGQVVIAGNVDEISWFGFSEGRAPAATGGKWGYLDANGKWVIEPQFESAGPFTDGFAVVLVGGRRGLIDQNGKFVVNPQYYQILVPAEGYAGFEDGIKWGFIDMKGRVVIAPSFIGSPNTRGTWERPVGPFSQGLAAVKTDSGWGYINATGKLVVEPQFDSADEFQDGLAHVTALGKEAYITTAGAFVVDPFPGTTVKAQRARLAEESAEMLRKIAGEWMGTLPNIGFAHLILGVDGTAIVNVPMGFGWRQVFSGRLDHQSPKLILNAATQPVCCLPYIASLSLSTGVERLRGSLVVNDEEVVH